MFTLILQLCCITFHFQGKKLNDSKIFSWFSKRFDDEFVLKTWKKISCLSIDGFEAVFGLFCECSFFKLLKLKIYMAFLPKTKKINSAIKGLVLFYVRNITYCRRQMHRGAKMQFGDS